VSEFRQDSLQWDLLHRGRCTTSQTAAALGFLEPLVGDKLGIPWSLRKGALGAFHRLSEEPLVCLKEMNEVLISGKEDCVEITDEKVWQSKIHDPQFPFVAKYLPRINPALRTRKSSGTCHMQTRMRWGSVQESTSVLMALNYFCSKNPSIVIKEAGMCVPSPRPEILVPDLFIGASPDGVIIHPNGTVEALEVKNHCPFVAVKGRARQKGKFKIREFDHLQAEIPLAYLPQLMMEMVCLGPHCRSVVFVRQTATRGAIILRLHRDDEWIQKMFEFLNQFVVEYVRPGVAPKPNFFWTDEREDVKKRYRSFVDRTKEVGKSVELVHYVQHREIQRALSTVGNVPLFLD